ncbi:hypothetical protein NQ318_015744 [Aromia moschata]|uniref:Uncharacterized protein n=1 Tax=Aromia moschata TaxID=1265417 RepID=A0AAV8X5E7_9CUCU|nr:hypothetical protein NQ318_015744 [Aromia moschata]
MDVNDDVAAMIQAFEVELANDFQSPSASTDAEATSATASLEAAVRHQEEQRQRILQELERAHVLIIQELRTINTSLLEVCQLLRFVVDKT